MEITLLVFEIVGTVAFAVSGAMTALTRHMDIFGVAILGLMTAVGGGAIRDITLGLTPPAMFTNPLYAILALLSSVLVFLPSVRWALLRKKRMFDTVLLVMDSLGLGVFTVAGIQTALRANENCGVFLLLFVGVITGVGGGVLRDVLAGNTPYIFVKHVYACASLSGAAVCVAMWHFAGGTAAMLGGASVTVALRLLAAHYRWSLPHAD